jgi:hypothetical protein
MTRPDGEIRERRTTANGSERKFTNNSRNADG